MTENRYDVLVAEDEAIIALEIKQLLSRHNYNVVGVVKSGEEMVKVSRKKNPDVIVSAVVPIPDEIKGQAPVAFVCLKPGVKASPGCGQT